MKYNVIIISNIKRAVTLFESCNPSNIQLIGWMDGMSDN